MVECPVCLRDVELKATAKAGDVILCPYCKVLVKLVLVDGQLVGVRLERI